MTVENLYKKISHFTIQLFDTLISLLKVIILSKGRSSFPKISDTTCIVLGNGPSLQTSLNKHNDFFAKHPLLCVNSFSITEEYSTLKPTFYVILDPGFWMSENVLVKNTFESIKTKTKWPLYLILPHIAKKSPNISNLSKSNSSINIIYFNYVAFKGFKVIGNWLYSKNLAIPQSQNVLVASLFLSLNIGFKEIYLFGADHSWHQNLFVNESNILCFKDSHFYDKKEKEVYQTFYKGLHSKEKFTMQEILFTFSKIFNGYMLLNEYSKYKKSKIYNASEISFIDAFERIKID